MICEKMKNVVNHIKTKFNNDLKKFDLTASQYVVLKYLIQNEGKNIIQKDIGEYLVLKHSTVIGIINRLEEKGLIKKETKHTSIISITSKGKNLYESIGDYETTIEDNTLRSLNKQEKQQLSILISKIYNDIIKEEKNE